MEGVGVLEGVLERDGVVEGVGVLEGVLGGVNEDDMARLPVPLRATATKRCAPVGPPQATDCQKLLFRGVVPVVHVMPSGLVITLVPYPVPDTATNLSAPVGPPQTTLCQRLLDAAVRSVHVMPSGLVITSWLPVPLWVTATNT
jgi:hypothetical protein